ncbi:hypothetical protein Vafri_11594, partial [Volvox africanus]
SIMGALVWRRSDDTVGAANKPNVAAQSQSQSQDTISHNKPGDITDHASASSLLKRPKSAPKDQSQPSALGQQQRSSYMQAPYASIPANSQAGMTAADTAWGDGSTRDDATPSMSRPRTGGLRPTMVQAAETPYEVPLQPHPKRRRREDSAAVVTGAWTTHEWDANCIPSVPASSYTYGSAPSIPYQRHGHSQAPGSISGSTITCFSRNSEFAKGPTRTSFQGSDKTMPISAATLALGAGIGPAAAGKSVGPVLADGGEGPHGMAARAPPVVTRADPVAQVAKTEAALEELRRQLAAKEETVRAKQNVLAARQAAKAAKEVGCWAARRNGAMCNV